MARPRKFTLAQVLDAVEQGQTLSGAARILGVPYDTMRRYAKRWPAVQEAILQQREHIVDAAERKLGDAVEAGEPWAVTLALKTLGRDRGYVERNEQAGVPSQPIEIVVRYVDGDTHLP
jgi:hypothetical protein